MFLDLVSVSPTDAGGSRDQNRLAWRLPTILDSRGRMIEELHPVSLRRSELAGRTEADCSAPVLWKVPVDGGKETLVFNKPIYPRYWTVTDQGIYFVPSDWAGRPAIEFFSFATGKVTEVVPLEKPPVRGFHPGLAVSPDGRWILCALLEQDTSDIMLVENFR